MRRTIYDIEICINRAMIGFMDVDTKEVSQFDYKECDEIGSYIRGRKLVGFNSLNFDDILLQQILDGANIKKLWNTTLDLIEFDGRRWDYRPKIKSIDLIEVAPGQASLKLYGTRLGSKKLQDLPYDPNKKHSKKMWKNVCDYNLIDLEVTYELYQELLPQLGIRGDIGSQYHVDVMSKSDAQAAETVFKKQLGIDKKPKIDKPKSVSYTAPKYVKFKSKQLKDLKKKFEDTTYDINPKTGKFIAQDWLKEKVVIDGIDYTIGYGGLHSNEKSIAVVADMKNADISSMYPSLIINSGKYPVQLGAEWLTLYTLFRDKRMEIKHTDKKLSAMLKIFLNGSFGKLNSVYSILYAPHLMLDTTITGQLSLLMVIEALGDAGIKVISANTDGVEYIDSTNKGRKIIDKLGKKMNLGWEYAEYKALYARDVNSYVALYDGYVKAKGFYGEPTLSKNSEYPIVTEAIRKFLLDGTPMKKTIKKCKDVLQFCVARAVTGGAVWSDEVYPNTLEFDEFIVAFEAGERKDNKALRKRNENYQRDFVLANAEENYIGKSVRFIFVKDGHALWYKKSGNKVPKSEGCRPMMELTKKVPKDLDYSKYFELADRHLLELGWKK